MASPQTRYAAVGDHSIAYQLVGEGDGVDLVYVPPLIGHVEHYWDHPPVARALRRMSSLGRLLLYDRRSTGMSDPSPGAYTLDDEVSDLLMLLDVAEMKSPALVAQLTGGPLACLLAATRPERVSSLVLHSCFARVNPAEDYPWGSAVDQRAAAAEQSRAQWGQGLRAGASAPSWIDDPAAIEWLGRLERLSVSPHTMLRLSELINQTDVRAALPAISAPTLVTRRRDDEFLDPGHAQYLAAQIPGAELRELPGRDAMLFAGDVDAVIDEIGRFVVGRPPPMPDRAMATLLFTDIVDSTALLTSVGDTKWRDLLIRHDDLVGRLLREFAGRQVKMLGDGVFAAFTSAAAAIACALRLIESTDQIGIPIRAGVHVGECELIADDFAGQTVHEAARIAAAAGTRELLISDAVKGLTAGAELSFDDRGNRELKGLPGEYRLWRVGVADA